MSLVSFSALACPLDGHPMRRKGQAWHCDSGHSFDIARQGYTHLHPVQHKRSRDPGDSKTMVAARQRFLNAGHYRPVAEAVSQAVLADWPGDGTLHCLDAGCGEGYYLRQLIAAGGHNHELSLLGLDISKWAVLSAAKQERAVLSAAKQERAVLSAAEQGKLPQGEVVNWVVASNAHLPVLSNTLDRVMCLFGFPVGAEFARVLKAGGILVRADVGPDHLRELREVIYPSLKPERSKPDEPPAGFAQLSATSVRFPVMLSDAEQIADLLSMTPHLYRASVAGRERAAALTSLSVTIDVRLTRFERLARPITSTPVDFNRQEFGYSGFGQSDSNSEEKTHAGSLGAYGGRALSRAEEDAAAKDHPGGG